MKYSKILLAMTVLVCLAFQAFALPVSDSQTNKSLSNTSLNNTTINNSSLKNSSLNNASLKNTSLNNASLKNSSLNNASLKNTSLNNASLNSTMGSSGDYLNPNMGQKYPQNWMEGGYYPNFPWYTTGGSFYSQP